MGLIRRSMLLEVSEANPDHRIIQTRQTLALRQLSDFVS